MIQAILFVEVEPAVIDNWALMTMLDQAAAYQAKEMGRELGGNRQVTNSEDGTKKVVVWNLK